MNSTQGRCWMMVGRTFLSMTRCFKYGIDRVGIFQADRGPKSNLDSPKQVQSYFGTIPECRFGNFGANEVPPANP